MNIIASIFFDWEWWQDAMILALMVLVGLLFVYLIYTLIAGKPKTQAAAAEEIMSELETEKEPEPTQEELAEQERMAVGFVASGVTAEDARRYAGFSHKAKMTMDYTIEDIIAYIMSLPKVQHTPSMRTAVYKIKGKTFAMFSNQKIQGRYKLAVKCDPYYAEKLSELYPKNYYKAKFPKGERWYTVEDNNDCALEVAKLLIEISYNIAKAGF